MPWIEEVLEEWLLFCIESGQKASLKEIKEETIWKSGRGNIM